MKASRIALGFLLLGLAQCSGDRGLLVGGERERGGSSGEAGEANGSGGSSVTGGSGGAQSRGGSESSGGNESSGGSPTRGGTGSGAEGGEGAEPGTGGSGARGGTDAGGSGGDAGSVVRGGSGGGDQGGSGGMDRGGSGGVARGGTAGTSGTDCDALAREYQQLLAAAQQCAPMLTIEQCTSQMPDSIVCGCPTFVNPMRTEEIRRMNEIIEKSRACIWICPAVVCPAIGRGTCSADAIVGTDRGRCTVVR